MKHATEVVIYKNGKPASGLRVSLEFGWSGGFTKDFYTNSQGIARVEHDSEGRVKVYIDGNHSKYGITGYAPGRIPVNL